MYPVHAGYYFFVRFNDIPIFQLKAVVADSELEKIRADIRRQIENGMVVVDSKLIFWGLKQFFMHLSEFIQIIPFLFFPIRASRMS